MLGGARSGKSAHAEGLLPADDATYVATARLDPDDAEWRQRIAAHVARRPPGWRTVEPTDLPGFLGRARGPVIVDDLATWLTGVMDDYDAWHGGLDGVRGECDRLVEAVTDCPAQLVLVSAEVGLGVVPATRSGRLFRDQLGTLNADLAQRCAEVVLLVAGIPLRLR
ncbi:adenosylcobinamide kinase /adenosylcobinamide-phosphate guanylyltransferase [Actinophytocola oryzae]|uniref:Adenosylcobinamide kinase n=1 Tax=Actinophytocola oryzae TaxID=502181 RepID=A0A4R7UY38_9PSEU|nr:adenosylcobinamide kinase /adenosylcobinamide-phosphate guanylyltransferase [Actinophytocola oryzae]